jgi:hypothetical protein
MVFGGYLFKRLATHSEVEGNHTPAFGTQVTYKPPSDKVVLELDTHVGNEQPDIDKMALF